MCEQILHRVRFESNLQNILCTFMSILSWCCSERGTALTRVLYIKDVLGYPLLKARRKSALSVTSRSFHPLGFAALIYLNAWKTEIKEALSGSVRLCWSSESHFTLCVHITNSAPLNRCILDPSRRRDFPPESRAPDSRWPGQQK